MGRSNIKQVAEKRKQEIARFLHSVFLMAAEIAHSDLVYTFFHPILRDQQEANIHARKVKGNSYLIIKQISCKCKIFIQFIIDIYHYI